MFGWFQKQKPLDIEGIISKVVSIGCAPEKRKTPLFYGLQGLKIDTVEKPIFIVLSGNWDCTHSWLNLEICIIDQEGFSEVMRSLDEICSDPRVSFYFNHEYNQIAP